jgi:hypothetical protein
MAIDIISQSTWVDYVEFNHDSGEVSTGTSFIIHFIATIAVDSLISANFRIYDVEADSYLSDPWMGIVVERDYSLLNRVLNLYLELPLEIETTYQIIIQDLENGAGETMPSPHIVQFDTSPIPSPIDYQLDELPAYMDDHSIIAPGDTEDIDSADATDFYVVETSPPDGTMQVDVDDVTQIIIRFSENVGAIEGPSGEDYVRVYRRTIDRLWHPYVEITDDLSIVVVGPDIIITLPLDSTPTNHYLDYNTEYRVAIDAEVSSSDATPISLGQDYTLSFYAEFQPLYLDPMELVEQFPDLTTEELYIAVYKASMDAYRFADNLELSYESMTDLPYAAQEYTRLRSIYLNSMSSEESANKMQLADLMIASDRSWLEELKNEMDRWQYELEIYGGGKRLGSFTKASGLVPPPEEISPTTTSSLTKYTGSQTRRRNDWFDG